MPFTLSQGFQIGQSLGGLTGGLFGAQKEEAKLRKLEREINTGRVSRQIRYEQGLQAVSGAASGNTQYGSLVSIAADDARKAQERLSQVALSSEQQRINSAFSRPTFGQRLFSVGGSLAEIAGPTILRDIRRSRRNG